MTWLLEWPGRALAWLGRRGTAAVGLSIFVGLLVPGTAAVFKPWLGVTVFVLLCLSFLRVDPAALWRELRRPGLVLAVAIWIMVAVPLMLGGLFTVLGLRAVMPGLYFIVMLQVSAPGLMAAPAMAALIGLDVALTLAGLILCTAMTPLTAAAFTHLFLGVTIIPPVTFGTKLFLLIAGSALTAAIVRAVVGRSFIEARHDSIDGLSVIGMFIFAMAAVGGVGAHFMADPWLVIRLLLLAFAVALGMIALTTVIFLPAGRGRAFAVGILAGYRNLGVMLAAAGFAIPDTAWLYFGLAQFPIYLLPQFFKPLAKRLTEGHQQAS
ncbi:MAG TPA: Na+-dependent transporter [Pseudolabrys sp.]|nr:Na+-dependent transporter [Pseudolabrys sp.]